MSTAALPNTTPVVPPRVNSKIKLNAKIVEDIVILLLEPMYVDNQLKILVPVGSEIRMVLLDLL